MDTQSCRLYDGRLGHFATDWAGRLPCFSVAVVVPIAILLAIQIARSDPRRSQ